MAFTRNKQVFGAKINTVTIGSGANEITLGGENVLPFYTFDEEIEHRPKIGVAITDSGYYKGCPGLEAYYSGAATVADAARRAAAMPGADFLVIRLDGAHPDKEDKTPGECAALISAIADATDIPIAVEGCKNFDKDARLFETICRVLDGKNIMILSAHEENYKAVAAAAGLAYKHKTCAESSVDINLAKQLNVLITQLGVKPGSMALNPGSAAAGYGFEYVASTIERIKLAALGQSDAMLQMPVVVPVDSEAWAVKESIAQEDDFPGWGSRETRAVNMEITTAAACLAAGCNAVILRHPDSVAAISALIQSLLADNEPACAAAKGGC